jgi:diguanylate cyclase (GGDEF)-like protein
MSFNGVGSAAQVIAPPDVAVLTSVTSRSTHLGVVATAAVAGAIAVSALLGWALDVPILTTWDPGNVTIKANAAVCFLLGSSALLTHARSDHSPVIRNAGTMCAVLMLVLATVTLAEYAFDRNLGIDQVLVHSTALESGTSHSGRMAPNTALEFVLIAVALVAARAKSRRGPYVAQACTFGALFLVLVALVGYVYGAHVLVGLFSQTRMAVNTIVAMLALVVGVLWLTAHGGWLADVTAMGHGQVVARRLLPAAFLIPLTVGIVTLSGYRAGLYDPAFGAAIMAVVETVSFTTLVWLCARSLNETERGRSLAGQDELTGLLNRRGFLVQGAERQAIARRLGEDALLLFIDLDGMKGINDTLGHAAGDRALVEAARVLRTTFRDGDVLARLGGDEFAVFAGRAPLESAPWMLSRLKANLARLNAEPARDYILKLSTGITPCLAADNSSIADLLGLADAEMYEQKARTRGGTPRSSTIVRSGDGRQSPSRLDRP